MFGKILAAGVAGTLALGVVVVTVVGPWPTYSAGFENKGYYTKAVAGIAENIKESHFTDAPGALEAGWAVRDITPPVGTPLAGYGDRQGAPSTGVHDPVKAKAIALSDGEDAVVLIGADILLMPENVAALVRGNVAKQTPLTPNDLYFTASHTHASVGAFGPGLAAYVTGGEYDPAIVEFLTKQFTDVIVEAYKKLAPAEIASGSVDAPEFVKNRTRKAPTDPELSFLVVRQKGGDMCTILNYSAHPTILGGDSNMEFSAEWPGYLQRAVARETAGEAMYLGGALGSSGPRAPSAPDDFARCEAMGEGLAKLALTGMRELEFKDKLDIVSVGVEHGLPPLQLRPVSPNWRVSKFLGPLAGLDTDGWVHGVRIGDIVFIGMPADFSCEISKKWKEAAAKAGLDMWVTSFCADYVGYVSPDEYYDEPGYETGLMSWTGPHQEAFFTALKDHLVAAMTGGA